MSDLRRAYADFKQAVKAQRQAETVSIFRIFDPGVFRIIDPPPVA